MAAVGRKLLSVESSRLSGDPRLDREYEETDERSESGDLARKPELREERPLGVAARSLRRDRGDGRGRPRPNFHGW